MMMMVCPAGDDNNNNNNNDDNTSSRQRLSRVLLIREGAERATIISSATVQSRTEQLLDCWLRRWQLFFHVTFKWSARLV